MAHLGSMLRQRDPREVLRQRQRSLQEGSRRLARAIEAISHRIESGRAQVSAGRERLIGSSQRSIRERQSGLRGRSERLAALAPEQTLQRGYSICLDRTDGSIIRDARQAHPGQPVRVLLAACRLGATVDQVEA